jgi:hypothetical protein
MIGQIYGICGNYVRAAPGSSFGVAHGWIVAISDFFR